MVLRDGLSRNTLLDTELRAPLTRQPVYIGDGLNRKSLLAKELQSDLTRPPRPS